MAKKKAHKTETPSRRDTLYMDRGDRFLNIRLTSDELMKLNRVAEFRREKTRDAIYPVVLHYLNDCAEADDKFKVTRAAEVVKDHYWGTEEEINNPRLLPKNFTRRTEDRPRFTQQIVPDRALKHLRAITEYYRVSMNDLLGSAVEYLYTKLVEKPATEEKAE